MQGGMGRQSTEEAAMQFLSGSVRYEPGAEKNHSKALLVYLSHFFSSFFDAALFLSEASEATATLGPRYNLQYGQDYRQNVYIPGSTATLTPNPQQQVPQQALPPPQALPPAEVPKAAQTPASKKKPTKKDKK